MLKYSFLFLLSWNYPKFKISLKFGLRKSLQVFLKHLKNQVVFSIYKLKTIFKSINYLVIHVIEID